MELPPVSPCRPLEPTQRATPSPGHRARAWHVAAATGLFVVFVVFAIAVPQAGAQRQSGRVVADAKYTSPYDAFMKMNRFREDFLKDESATEYWGSMESRLGNQAGRILIKRPTKGFDDDSFRGWLMFVRSYGDANGIGNCAACHPPSGFTDGRKHNIGTSQEPIATPSLRNLKRAKSFLHDGSAATIEAAIARHVENSQVAQQNKRAGVDLEVGKIALTPDEVRQVAAFLNTLDSVDRDAFREHLVDIVVQPVEIDFSN